MEKDVDAEIIKTTQSSLGKFVKRPPLTEKLLRKPPFRFLHDVVTTVLKTTGFFEGLFDPEELVSDNVKDRESKILFLNKVITVVGTALGRALTVKPSKIVAGQEADKTNELLQLLAEALDKNISSNEAVKKYKESTTLPSQADKKSKQIKTVTKSNDVKKLTSNSSEKITKPSNKRDSNERSLTRNEKPKVSVTSKTKQKEPVPANKKESPPKKKTASLTKNNSGEKFQQDTIDKEEDRAEDVVHNITRISEQVTHNTPVAVEEKSELPKENPELIDSINNSQHLLAKIDQDKENLNASYTIAENDLNSSLSSQDLMEVDNDKAQKEDTELVGKGYAETEKQFTTDIKNKGDLAYSIDNHSNKPNPIGTEKKLQTNNSFGSNNSETEHSTKESEINSQQEDIVKPNTRPKSVRPSSSRPAAPRLREKHDNVLNNTDNLMIGKVNIITENAPNEEEEDNSIVIVEEHPDPNTTRQSQEEHIHFPSNQHGHLVQQILESQKELSQTAGKTEIEWQFGAQKAREAVNQEIEQLRFNIQALSRVANPLGKLLDHLQEDVEVMRQELQQWTKSNEDATKELLKQKTANEDSLFPLHSKLKQLHIEIEEKHEKINDLKINIHKNGSRIEKLLASGNVQ